MLEIYDVTHRTTSQLGVTKALHSRQTNPKGLFTPKTHVFSAADILLRIYQNPMHLNGTRWRTTFWRQREVRRRKKR